MSNLSLETADSKPKRTIPQDALTPTLYQFLHQWDVDYQHAVSTIPLFTTTATLDWPLAKKQFFCKLFYHARGHLSDFLWMMGNMAPNAASKDLVLYNYAEEFGHHAPSHEQLYYYFAHDMGLQPLDVTDPNYYLEFLQEFNEGHLRWLKTHTWDSCLAAYSAYERLDNLDYVNLLKLAKHLDASNKGLIFFKLHSEVEHFSATTALLNKAWQHDEAAVTRAFQFIAHHQQTMWHQLADAVF